MRVMTAATRPAVLCYYIDDMLPFQCYLCNSQETTDPVCPPCLDDIKQLAITRQCKQCGAPDTPDRCGACISAPPNFDRAVVAYQYAIPLDMLIRKFKYSNGWQLSKFFARHILPPPPTTDLVIPLPLHPNREKKRGYNQARELCKSAGLPLAPDDYLRRTKDTPPQAGIDDRKERIRNVRGAFHADLAVFGKTVLLVDDIMTTGATISEAAAALKKSGATFVIAYLIARVAK